MHVAVVYVERVGPTVPDDADCGASCMRERAGRERVRGRGRLRVCRYMLRANDSVREQGQGSLLEQRRLRMVRELRVDVRGAS